MSSVPDPTSILPDGTEFVSWEQPCAFTRTYYVDGSAPTASDSGPGTQEQPFRTISRAAQVLEPGERVVIAGGIYRECVRPARGGTGPERLISYEAAPGQEVIVRGSAVLEGEWEPSTEWLFTGRGAHVQGEPQVWQIPLDGALFGGYNPFGLLNISADKAFLDAKHLTVYLLKRGMVFVDGQPLRQAYLPQEIAEGAGCFWVEHNGLTLHVRFPGDSHPAAHEVEITNQEQLFAPSRPLGYIRLRGITFEHAANGFPVPQRGAVSAARGHHWIIEGCTIQWANSVGLDLGNECWHRTRPAGEFSHHIVRGNTIRHCGVCGIASIRSRDLLVEDNLIEHIGRHHANHCAESAGIKVHHSTNMLFRRNVVRDTNGCPAVWLDWENANCRITGNVLAHVYGHLSFAAIHLECDHDVIMVDNNIIWDVQEAERWEWEIDGYRQVETEGNAVNLRGTDGVIFAHNLVGECGYSALWPVNTPYRTVTTRGGTTRDIHVYNNIIHRCGEAALHFNDPHNQAEGNLYSGFRGSYLRILHPIPQWLDLETWRRYYGWDMEGVLANAEITFDPDTLTLHMNLPAEAVPVTARGVEADFDGQAIGTGKRYPGPFGDPSALRAGRCVDPRRK